MPREGLEFRISFRKLVIGAIATVVPISLIALYVLTNSARRLEQNLGRLFQANAESIATEVAQFIRAHVIEAGLMATDSAVLEDVIAANRRYEGMAESQISARIQKIDSEWNAVEGEPLVRQILSSRISRALRRKLSTDPKFLRITVTDQRGATVGATHKTLDYYQADEEYWQNIYAEGRGQISLTDILFDEATKANYVGIGVPIVADDGTQVLGTLDALVDVTSLFPFLDRLQLGPNSRVLLVKGDSTVISSSAGRRLRMNVKSQEFDAVLDAATSVDLQPSGYTVADLPGSGETLIGFTDTGLEQDFQELDWFVLVAQPTSEAFAGVRAPQQFILLMAFLGLGAVVLLSVYVSLHQKDEPDEAIEPYSYGGANPLR